MSKVAEDYEKSKAKKKAEMDAKKNALRAEDIAKGVFAPVSSLPIKAFLKLNHECKADVATLENGIQANEDRIKSYTDLRKAIVTYNRTKPIYEQYQNTKFFKERFRIKNESDIIDHENALSELRYHQRPLPKIKEIDEAIARNKTANVSNRPALAEKKAELKELGNIHTFLFYLDKGF